MVDKIALVFGIIAVAYGLYLVLKREKPVDPPAEGFNKAEDKLDKTPPDA